MKKGDVVRVVVGSCGAGAVGTVYEVGQAEMVFVAFDSISFFGHPKVKIRVLPQSWLSPVIRSDERGRITTEDEEKKGG